MVADRGDGPDVSFCSYVGKVLSAGAVLQSSRCFIVNNAPRNMVLDGYATSRSGAGNNTQSHYCRVY